MPNPSPPWTKPNCRGGARERALARPRPGSVRGLRAARRPLSRRGACVLPSHGGAQHLVGAGFSPPAARDRRAVGIGLQPLREQFLLLWTKTLRVSSVRLIFRLWTAADGCNLVVSSAFGLDERLFSVLNRHPTAHSKRFCPQKGKLLSRGPLAARRSLVILSLLTLPLSFSAYNADTLAH